jgi:hypothetical protein
MNTRTVGICCLALLFALACCGKPTIQERLAPEQELARFDSNESDTSISRYRFLLEEISLKTKTDARKIEEFTVNAQDTLHKRYGKDVSLLTILEDINQALPHGKTTNYSEAIAMYVVIKGTNLHSAAALLDHRT